MCIQKMRGKGVKRGVGVYLFSKNVVLRRFKVILGLISLTERQSIGNHHLLHDSFEELERFIFLIWSLSNLRAKA